ncbi:DUF6030 family protein [Agrobacterium sp. NPDC090273]|uniref:DUF6030 family protein n=1 Tax=Agrobacterium sp. NPDC090273 TaxID=3363919 RepID=UPI00383AC4AB
MSASLQERRSKIAPLIAVLGVCLAIAATVLLANDKRHLKSLLHHFGVAPVVKPIDNPPKMTRIRRKPLVAGDVNVPAYLLKFEQSVPPTFFVRNFLLPGAALCERFLAEGFVSLQDGNTSPVNGGSFECMADFKQGDASAESEQASLFLDIRGNAAGEIRSIRIKAIAPQTPDGDLIRSRLRDVLALIVGATHWSDFSSLPDLASRMQVYQEQRFGISASSKPEPSAPHRLNVLLLEVEKPRELELARAFFDDTRWLRSAAAIGKPEFRFSSPLIHRHSTRPDISR